MFTNMSCFSVHKQARFQCSQTCHVLVFTSKRGFSVLKHANFVFTSMRRFCVHMPKTTAARAAMSSPGGVYYVFVSVAL